MRRIVEVFAPVAALCALAGLSGVPWPVIVGLAGVTGAGLGWRYERAQIENRTRDTVMASVMDSQNNLLNNMVYFRLRAEADGMSAADLSRMDEAIRDAQHRLVEIAESNLDETRDLGGIKVLDRPRARTRLAG